MYKFYYHIYIGDDAFDVPPMRCTLLKQAYRDGKMIKWSAYKPLAIACFIALWILCGVVLNEKVSFYTMEIGNYFLFMIAGICGSIAFIELCKLLEKTKIKRFFIKTAENSIIIIGTHYVLISILQMVAEKFNLLNTWQYTLISICFTIVSILIYNFFGKFFDKYFPAITGKMK